MGTYQITGSNGGVYEVEAVDDDQAARLEQYINRQIAAGDADLAKAPVPDGGRVDRPKSSPAKAPWTQKGMLGSFGNAAAGLVTGAAAIPDMLTQGLGSALGLGARGIGAGIGAGLGLAGFDAAGDSTRDFASGVAKNLENPLTVSRAVDFVAPKPTDPVGSFARSVSEGLGGVLGGLGIGGLAARGGGSLSRGVGQALLDKPGGQILSGGAAGGAVNIAAQAGLPAPVQLAAGLIAGGVAPAGLRGVGGAIEAGTDTLTNDGVRRAAAGILRQNITTSPEQVIQRASMQRAPRSGALPTLAEVSLDPGIAALQRGVGNLSGPAGARLSSRLSDNALRRADAIDSSFGSGDPRDTIQAAERAAQSLAARRTAAIGRVGPVIEPDEAGRAGRDLLATGYQGARARTSAAYGADALMDDPPVQLRPLGLDDVLAPDGPAAQPDIRGFQDEATRGLRSALPPKPRSLLQFVRQQGGIASADGNAGDLRSVGMNARGAPTLLNERGRSLDELVDAAEESGYMPAGSTRNDLIDALDDENRGLGARYADGDLNEVSAYDAASEARDFWRKNFDERQLDPTKMSDEDWRSLYEQVAPGASDDAGRSLYSLEAEGLPGRTMGPFQTSVMAMRDRFFGDGAAEAPAYVRSFFDEVINADSVGLRTLEGWERRALDMAGKSNDRQTAAFLQSVGKAIGARASMEGGPARRAALSTARAARREQGDVFERGAVGRSLSRDRYGNYVLPDSNVGAAVFPRGRTGGETVDQSIRAGGSGIEGVARAELRRSLDSAGSDPLALGRVARDYREGIGRFPAIASDVRAARESALAERNFGRSEFGALTRPNADTSAAVSRALTVKDGGRSLRNLAEQTRSSRPAQDGIRRSMAEFVDTRSRTNNVDASLQSVPGTAQMGRSLAILLDRTKDTRLLDQTQRAALNAIRRELRGDQFARTANKTTGSDTARNAMIGMNAFRTALKVAPGGAAKNVVEFLAQKLSRTEDILAMVNQATLDPAFAADLLRAPTTDMVARTMTRIRSFNTAAAEGTLASSSEIPTQP